MSSKVLRSMGMFALAGALVATAACERQTTEPGHFGAVAEVEIRDRATNTLYLESHGDHWDGPGIPHLHVGEEIALNVHFFDAEGNEANLGGGEFELRVRLADAARDGGVEGTPGIVDFSAHGDHADIEGIAEGETYLVFQLYHGNHSDFDTMPIEFEVDDH